MPSIRIHYLVLQPWDAKVAFRAKVRSQIASTDSNLLDLGVKKKHLENADWSSLRIYIVLFFLKIGLILEVFYNVINMLLMNVSTCGTYLPVLSPHISLL